MRVNDSSVLVARRMVAQKVLVLREDDSILRERKRDMFQIGSRNQVCIGRCCDIQAPQTQAMSNRLINVLVKMKPYHDPIPRRLVSVPADLDHWQP